MVILTIKQQMALVKGGIGSQLISDRGLRNSGKVIRVER